MGWLDEIVKAGKGVAIGIIRSYSEFDVTKTNLVGVLGYIGDSDGKNTLDSTGPPYTAGVLGLDQFSNNGVVGQSVGGRGVAGFSETGQGVYGHSVGQAGVVGESDQFDGLFGHSLSSAHAGTTGENDSGGIGVFGSAPRGGVAVRGDGRTGATGVQGISDTGVGVAGESRDFDGVNGLSHSPEHAGIAGKNDAGGMAGYFDGRVEVFGDVIVHGDICMPRGQDLAEAFTSGETHIEPGTVVVFGDEDTLQASRVPYDRRVAGIVSGAGKYRPGVILAKPRGERCLLALAGRVYCKVDASYSPIAMGDLLTTSATPGHAMRAANSEQAFGSVIGKALRPVDSGVSLIPILVTLQ